MQRHPDRLVLIFVALSVTVGAIWLVTGLGIH